MANDAGPEAKRWALSATAILTALTRRAPRFDLLGGAENNPDGQGSSKALLASAWGVDSRDKLVSTLEWLSGTGHSAEFQQVAAAFAQAPPQARQQDPKLAFVGQFGGELGPRGLMAWDLGRAIAVAGWGYLAGLCSEEEAWGASLSAGVRVRAAYGSWDEYAKHYRLGALFHDANSVGPIDQVIGQLSSAPDSPWRAVPWSLDAAAAPAPAAGGFGPPLGGPGVGAIPVTLPGAAPPPGFGPAGAVTPGVIGGPPPYGGVPVVAPPGAPGAPAAYGNVPVIAPPPPGAPGAPGAYGGVPVIAPTGGAGAYGAATPGGSVKKKGPMLLVLAVGGFVVLSLIIVMVLHFRHHEAPPAPAPEPAHHGKPHR